jgi:glycerophosphoryl diester phosphodiesterase
MSGREFMNIAHRGASAYAPENTFAAFDKALALGAVHVEFDLHFSKDGHIVIIHDETLERTTDGTGLVAETDLADLRSLDAGSWFSPEFAGEPVPTFGGMLERYKGRFHFHIEIKAEVRGLSRRAADMVRGYGVADNATITAFQLASLEELVDYAPELPTGWLVVNVDDATVDHAKRLGLKLLCPHSSALTPELVDNLHQNGLEVRAWGAADEGLMRKAVDAGVDGLTVNFPDKLSEYLASK